MNTPPPPLWTHDEATAATGGRTAGEKAAPWTADGVSIDSRTLEKNDLFIAIAGPNFDGHDFVGKAFAADAAAAMVSHLPESPEDSRPLLLVDDTRQGLENLAAAARARTAARITAITGSVGKTSTKEALRLALEPQGATTASIGNLNNQWGVPLSLARMPGESVFGVFELGMNHPGEIVPLSKMVRPHVAIITSIEPVHSEFFASIAHIAEAKAEIFQGMDEGAAVLPRENPFFPVLAETAHEHGVTRIIGFGAHPEADARLVECDLQPLTSHISASICGTDVSYELNMPGRHWIINSLAVLAAVDALGGDVREAAETLSSLEAIEGRGRHFLLSLAGGECELFDESYNASPTSMRAAISVLSRARLGKAGRRIAVLGDMLELGQRSASLHASLVRDLEQAKIDLVFTAGAEMKHLRDALSAEMRGGHAVSAAALAPMVKAALKPGDVITVKGSYGSHMRDVVAALTDPDNAPPQAANGN